MDKTQYALKELSDAFRQCSRNGRWGTCGGCPRDRENHAYPEFCGDTKRYDHQLTVAELAATWERYCSNDQAHLRVGERKP
jgi:hypothetical protein